MLCSPRSLRPRYRIQWLLDALLALSFCCVALYWISQRTVDAAAVPTGGSSATVADGFLALTSWGWRLISRLSRVATWPASAGGQQDRGSHSSAQHSARPGFTRMTLRARWSRTLAGIFAVARPLPMAAMRYVEALGSFRLRLLLPRLSYAAAATALTLGCSLHLSGRRQACVPDPSLINHLRVCASISLVSLLIDDAWLSPFAS